MSGKGNLIRVTMAILILALPAVTLSVLSNYYDAPYLQPLDLTEEGFATANAGTAGTGLARIDVQVDWGRDWPGTLTQTQLRDVIATTLQAQTKHYSFDFVDVPGARIEVTFIVGRNIYGPFPPGQMVSGINSALIALKMTNGPEY